jgi:hypothetical protein
MIGYLGSQVHYRTSFELIAKNGARNAWADIVKLIRRWISDKHAEERGLGGSWFYAGGDWISPKQSRVHIHTLQCIGKGSSTAPEFWALRYQHPNEPSVPYRQWQVDIGLRSLSSDHFHLSLTTTHWLLPGYIGEEPQVPSPTAPGIITSLVRSPKWKARSGGDKLTSEPTMLFVGNGHEFKQRLIAKDRILPIVLISLDFGIQSPLVDPRSLAWVLSGTALVYMATTSEVDKELEWLLPRHLRCWNGMVRLYQPHPDLADASDGSRHRYFGGDKIRESTPEKVTEMLVRGIVRRGYHVARDIVFSIDDVRTQLQFVRLAGLKSKADGQPTQEWIKALEDDNSKLDLRNRNLAEQVDRQELQILILEEDRTRLDDQIATLKYRHRELDRRVAEAEAAPRQMRTQLDTLLSMSRLPESLPEVISLIERIHQGTIVFTERSKRSARESSLNDMSVAWSCLWSMATILYELHFGESSDITTIEQEFRSRSGFDLSITEGKQTNQDKKLLALRKDTWNGKPIDITPHVKWGNKEPRLLRIHYAPMQHEKLIVVGHCGDHLTTSGTRKKK